MLGRALVWLAPDRSGRVCVVKASGFTPEVISTPALELAIQGYGDVSEAVADVYSDMGHTFYVLNFAEHTWVWDASTKLWAERGTWIPEHKEFTAWRPRFYAHAFGEHRILDSVTGHLYRMSPNLTLDVDGIPLRRLRRAPAPSSENKRTFYSSFELDMEVGLGIAEGPAVRVRGYGGRDVQPDPGDWGDPMRRGVNVRPASPGYDPQVMLRISNDGGKTWIMEQMRPGGKIGEYVRRVRWNRLGSARRRVFEVTATDPIPWRWVAAYVEASGRG